MRILFFLVKNYKTLELQIFMMKFPVKVNLMGFLQLACRRIIPEIYKRSKISWSPEFLFVYLSPDSDESCL